jgi:hypothetical protein
MWPTRTGRVSDRASVGPGEYRVGRARRRGNQPRQRGVVLTGLSRLARWSDPADRSPAEIHRRRTPAVWVHSPEVGRTGQEPSTRPRTVRMCVGCRHRTDKSELLRVVLVRDGDAASLLPDPSGRAPGRGAHVHPTRECFGLAERRRAFHRALRAEGPVDLEQLRRYIATRDVEEQGATTTRQSDRPALVPNASPDEGGTQRRVAPEQESGSSGS